MARQNSLFTTIRTEGGLLPTDLLALIAQGDKSIPGVSPQDYHLVKGELFGTRITDSWNRLRNAWKDFSTRLAALPDEDTGTTLTRDKWLQVLFKELEYGQLLTQRALKIDDKEFPVSHGWGQVPIHMISARLPIDRRTPGARGAAGASPHSMVQELLNRSEQHLWAFVSNGRVLRILRDNASLTRQAFVEFDLEAMFSDEVYEDFVVLWRTCHQSRVEGDNPQDFWLEKWTKVAAETGTRARDDLRGGVEAAIEALGTGFVSHPANTILKERLRSGDLDPQDLYRQLLRVIYRLLFLFVAEDRNLLHPPGAVLEAQLRYQRFYSLNRIRSLAGRRRGGPHPDLWSSLTIVFDGLGKPDGIPALALPGLGSFLWSPAACPDLDSAQIANQYLMSAVRHIGYVEDQKERVRRPIDYRNLGTEELGAIYESLLEQHPNVNTDAGTFSLNTAAGNERKTTGSYYTPTSLITELLDSAVDPVLDEACKQPDPEKALLNLSVIDPACGSGHFLIAAAHRIAKRLAAKRTGDDEPSPDATRTALRDVIARCVHGIDLNPMAVELCKVSLWMESMEPGKPLGFLDHRIIRGNGLIGATPELLDKGIPDEAFKALTGDDKTIVSNLKKRNKHAQGNQGLLFDSGDQVIPIGVLAKQILEIDQIGDDNITSIEIKATRWADLIASPEYQAAVHAADTWCAAFVAPKTLDAPAITQEEFTQAKDNPNRVDPAVRKSVTKLAGQYAFLHWHLAFPDIHVKGGFDLVLGNPPWEKIKLSEKEFFAARNPGIANLAGAKRKAAIRKLETENPTLWHDYQQALHQADGDSHFIRTSGRFPLCGRGDVNTYAVFAEAMRTAISPTGRLGVVIPTGIATDDTTKYFFSDIVTRHQLASLYDFENALKLFPGIAVINRFALVTIVGQKRQVEKAQFVFFAHQPSDLKDPERRFILSSEDLALINPNTKTAPVFRSRRDAEITKSIYQRVPVLVRDDSPDGNPWGIEFSTMFHMANDSNLFRTSEELQLEGATLTGNVWATQKKKWLPLYEAKMAHQYNHRDGDYAKYKFTEGKEVRTLEGGTDEDLADPCYVVQPRYWVEEVEINSASKHRTSKWLLGFRNITNSTTNRRTMVSFVLPFSGVGHSTPVIWATGSRNLLNSVLSSFALDYVARQKLGGTNMTFFIVNQLPIPSPKDFERTWIGTSLIEWLVSRTLELTFTAWDLEYFATESGYHGPPFKWDPTRRDLLRAELDAAFFHLYGIERDDADYIMETFGIVRRKDEATYGEYRTKRLILERYDALAEAAASGTEYQTVLNPPPADPSCAHPESTRPEWAN